MIPLGKKLIITGFQLLDISSGFFNAEKKMTSLNLQKYISTELNYGDNFLKRLRQTSVNTNESSA
jgi:hypothetical protein